MLARRKIGKELSVKNFVDEEDGNQKIDEGGRIYEREVKMMLDIKSEQK